jgi:hypothetical protein
METLSSGSQQVVPSDKSNRICILLINDELPKLKKNDKAFKAD